MVQLSKNNGPKVLTDVAIPVLPVVWAMFARALWSIGTGFEAIGLSRSGSNPPMDQGLMVDWHRLRVPGATRPWKGFNILWNI